MILSNFVSPAHKIPQDLDEWQNRARKSEANGVFIAVADRCRTERSVNWLGGSVIVRRGGYPAAGPVCGDRTAVLAAVVDLRLARDKRISEVNDLFTDRRLDLYARLWDFA
jgi:5-aminopentanamidase